MTRLSTAVLVPLLLLLRLTVLSAQMPQTVTSAQDLKKLSIEELAQLDVTTVSRRAEKLSETSAAISVIRDEDIRRSAVTTLPEVMRLADGVDVARANSSTWAVSARGFIPTRPTSCWSWSTAIPSIRRCRPVRSGTPGKYC